jgi:hypothetical protein
MIQELMNETYFSMKYSRADFIEFSRCENSRRHICIFYVLSLFKGMGKYMRAVIAQVVQRWATGWTIGVLGFDSRREM